MSPPFFLDESDIDTLINLLLRSQQSRTREALCFSIGIDPKRLSFIRDSSESDFFLLLIRYLNEIGEQDALCKLCCKELLPIFHQGKYTPILSDIAAKLNCNQRLSQNSPNNQQPTILSSIPASSVSVNPFYQLAKNKLIMGGTILLIGLAGFSLYNHNSYSSNNSPPTEQPSTESISSSQCGKSTDLNDPFTKGKNYLHQEPKQYRYAIDNFSQVIQNDPNCEEAYFSRGNAYYALDSYDEAFSDFSKVIKLNSQNSESYYFRGLIYSNR